ncbi:MAG: glycosyltransferase family 2 protein [Planctomycetes bacterium]|nr:glycosyltransferase family 2 protein [Planctomycetota bacterium]
MTPDFLTALPVFNEEAHIQEVLAEVRRHARDILVVDDGSTDATPRLLAQIPGLHVVRHETNRGYGAALKTAFEFAIQHKYDVLVTIDCDGQHEPSLIQALVECVYPDEGEPADIVSGSRYLKRFPGDSVPPEDRRRINAEITDWLNRELGLNLTDAFCGFKAYRTFALEKLQITELGYAMPLQVWVQAAELGLRIVEFPIPLIYLEEERSFGGALDDADRRMAYYRTVLEGGNWRPCAGDLLPEPLAPNVCEISGLGVAGTAVLRTAVARSCQVEPAPRVRLFC